MPDLRDLLERPTVAAGLTREEAADAMAALLSLQVMLTSRIRVTDACVPTAEPMRIEDEWITPDEAARLAGVTRRAIYGWSRRRDWSGFTARPSRKVLRIKRGGFLGWLESSGREARRS